MYMHTNSAGVCVCIYLYIVQLYLDVCLWLNISESISVVMVTQGMNISPPPTEGQ